MTNSYDTIIKQACMCELRKRYAEKQAMASLARMGARAIPFLKRLGRSGRVSAKAVYRGAKPVFKAVADFTHKRPFTAAGTSLIGGAMLRRSSVNTPNVAPTSSLPQNNTTPFGVPQQGGALNLPFKLPFEGMRRFIDRATGKPIVLGASPSAGVPAQQY